MQTAEFKDRALKLEMPKQLGLTQPWYKHSIDLKTYFVKKDLTDLLKDAIIVNTMYIGDCPAVDFEYDYLLQQPDFKSKWSKAIRYRDFGNPHKYSRAPQFDTNMIHCAYHVWKMEQLVGRQVSEFDSIIEIGGGYGAMADVCANLGFKGCHYIYDLPIMGLLQEYYLSNIGSKSKAFFINQKDTFKQLSGSTGKTLLIATWSVNEMPESNRSEILYPLLKSCDAFLFAYALYFERMDIKQYFEDLTNHYTDIKWQYQLISQMEDNHAYLMGTK